VRRRAGLEVLSRHQKVESVSRVCAFMTLISKEMTARSHFGDVTRFGVLLLGRGKLHISIARNATLGDTEPGSSTLSSCPVAIGSGAPRFHLLKRASSSAKTNIVYAGFAPRTHSPKYPASCVGHLHISRRTPLESPNPYSLASSHPESTVPECTCERRRRIWRRCFGR